MANPGYDGMWLPTDQDPRMQVGPTRGERACLVGYLEHYRQTLALKCDDLTAEQLATKAVPPSNISLLGLVRHMARVEQRWFRRVIEGRMAIPRLFSGEDEDAGFDFPAADDDLVRASHALWQSEIAYARDVLPAVEEDAEVAGDGAAGAVEPVHDQGHQPDEKEVPDRPGRFSQHCAVRRTSAQRPPAVEDRAHARTVPPLAEGQMRTR